MGGACSYGSSNRESNREESSSHGKRQNKKKASRITNEELREEEALQNGDLSRSSNSKEMQISSDDCQTSTENKFNDSKLPGVSKDLYATEGKDTEAIKEKSKAKSTTKFNAKEALNKFGTSFGPSTSSSLVPKKDNKINILCFEVANTIFKGSRLMDSLSEEKMNHCKEVLFRSEGVQNLISNDMNELLLLAASDKRRELKVFAGEIVRFGNRCNNPKFHNLDRFFNKYESEQMLPDRLKEIAREAIKTLMKLARGTSDLYLEMYLLGKFEQEYEKKCTQERNNNFSQKGDRAKDVKKQMDNQKSCIKDLKKEALWSKKLEEIVEKLVYIVRFLHLELGKAFQIEDEENCMNRSLPNTETLGSSGLALHYANIIIKMDNVVIMHKSLPESMKEELYKSLPQNIKAALRTELQLANHPIEEYTIHKVRRELEKTLKWLLPMAKNTVKAQQAFGWVGEISNTRTETDENDNKIQHELIKLQTLEHANKEKTDQIILDVLVLLHYLVKYARVPGR